MAKRVFLGTKSVLPEAIASGMAELKTESVPDFGRILLVLPGQAARRNVLKSLLAQLPSGFFPPQLLTPHLLMHYQLPEKLMPDAMTEEVLWGRSLIKAAANPERYPLLFPAGNIPADKFTAGSQLRNLRRELTAGGFSIADAAAFLGERGRELAAVEEIFCRELKKYGFTDPLDNDREAVKCCECFAEVEKIILAGLPDIPRMLRSKLENIDQLFPGKIEVWIGANQADEAIYDQWGMPVTEIWHDMPFDLPPENIHIAADPVDGARHAMFLAAENGVFDPENCAVVLADQSLYGDFAGEFSKLHDLSGEPVTVIDPSGVPFSLLRICRLWQTLLEFLKNSDDFLYASELIRQEDFLRSIARSSADVKRLLIQLDEFQQYRMPDNFDHALAIADEGCGKLLLGAMRLVKAWQKRFEKLPVTEFLRQFFTAVYRKNQPGNQPVCGINFEQESDFFAGKLSLWEKIPHEIFSGMDKLQQMEIFIRNCREEKISGKFHDKSIFFEGRLEMPFLTQKKLIFCGMNENLFPDRIDLTPFLTDSIRQKIGIRCNRETLARSLCHLMNVRDVREEKNLHLIVLKTDNENSSLRPSGILFNGKSLPEEVLLARCKKLFAAPETVRLPVMPPGDKEFQLTPEIKLNYTENGKLLFAVTDFDSYLRSPFEFLWTRILKMNPVDYSAWEPDSQLGGTLCHAAFEKLPPGKNFDTEEELEKVLLDNFDDVLRNRCGTPLPVMIKLFAANMKQRLSHAAELLFKEQQAGFKLLCSEYEFGGKDGSIEFAGAVFRGKIDRIEYDPARNIVRIIDIKTGKVDNVANEHCKFSKDGDPVFFWRLQLPLYALLLQKDEHFRTLCPAFDPEKIECAYLALPPEVTSSKMDIWYADDLNRVLKPAEICVKDIISQIQEFQDHTLYCDPDRLSSPLLLPDIRHALPDISWITPDKIYVVDADTLQNKQKSGDGSQSMKAFPVPPETDHAGNTRCCICPAEIRRTCSCCNGDCQSCKSFNGFKSFNIITASAGTGKTYALASRFIQLLDFGAEPDSILAITFTKKAAGEIFDRIIRRLCEMISEPHKANNLCLRISRDKLIHLIRTLLGNRDKDLQIGTIDSFFMSLLQAFAPEMGIWGKIVMNDDGDDRFLRQTLRHWLRTIPEGPELDALRELLKEACAGEQRTIYTALYELIDKVYSFYQLKFSRDDSQQMPQLKKHLWTPPETLSDASVCLKIALDIRNQTEILRDSKKNNSVLIRRLKALADQLEKSAAGKLYGKIHPDVNSLLDTLNNNNHAGWMDDPDDMALNYSKTVVLSNESAVLVRRACRHLREAAYRQCRAKNIAVFSLMQAYDCIYDKTIRRNGNITFNDLPVMLYSMDNATREIVLGNGDHSLEFRLDRKIKHYMFDEFQDTSDAQIMAFDPLFKELFSQIREDDFRSFFCVGDVKQSIYQWRGGNPELFNYVHNYLKKIGEELHYDPEDSLFRSYRSSQKILDTVNAVFCGESQEIKIFNQALPQMNYIPHVSYDQELPGHAALINVAQESTHSQQNIPAKALIIDKILRRIRPLERKLTVGILVPTNKAAKKIADELRRLSDWQLSVDGVISPKDCMAFNVFKELIISALHPSDKEAHAFLEMLNFSIPGKEKVPMSPAFLTAKLGFPAEIPLGESVRRDIFINRLGGFAKRFAEAFMPEITAFDRRRLEILCRAAENFSGTPEEFLRRIDSLGESGNSVSETIQIMTSHKAKGLEFDVVFMPDTTIISQHSNALPESEIIRYDGDSRDIRLPSWISYLPSANLAVNIPEMAKYLEMKSVNYVFEKICSLYVSMTRAKHALYILTSRNNPTKTFSPDNILLEKLPGYGVMNSDTELREILQSPDLNEYSPELLFSHGEWHWYIQTAPEISPPANKSEIVIDKLPEVMLTENNVRTASDEKSVVFTIDPHKRFASVNGKIIGTDVHRLFENMKFAGDDFDEAGFADSLNADPTAAAIFCHAMAKNSPIREFLREPVGEYELWREKRFILKENKTTVPGAFDRVVLHKENGVVISADIIDYKSDKMENETDFLGYADQLYTYRMVLSKMLDIPENRINCFILALKLQKVIEVK